MVLEPQLAYVLAADVGNTNITLACVRGDQVYVVQKVPADAPDALPAVLKELWEAMTAPRRLAACSVNPEALERLKAAAKATLDEPVAVVGEDIPLPLESDLPEPGKIGPDRLCAAAAAFARLERACVVVDCGTAITIDCVNADGLFIGGAILPGLALQATALHDQTALLPEVELREPEWVFGRNTTEAIITGIIRGARGAVREIVELYAAELKSWPLVIVTGGDAKRIGFDPGIAQAIVPELCLLGVARAFYQSLLPAEDE